MVLRSVTKERLHTAIKAFKLEDFHKYVLKEFKQVQLEDISQVVKQNRLQPSKKQIISVFLNLLLSKDLDNEGCERSIALLQVQAVALRPESRLWLALRLTGDPDNYGYSDSHVESLVSRSLRRNGTESITRAVHHSSAFWINITVKTITQRKGIVLNSPIFCVFFLGHPFMFISKRSSINIEKGLVEAFGFVEFSKSKLTGRDPRSMLEILATRDARLEVVNSASIDSEPLETTHGLDFGGFHKRKKYMDQIFPPDTPKLSDYSVECREAPWLASRSLPEMGDYVYPMSVDFRTVDTIGFFRALGEEGLVEVPLPSYIIRALNCARNKVKVRANKDLSVMDQTAAEKHLDKCL